MTSFGGDGSYHLALYAKYLRDPGSVPADWAAWFEESRHSAGGADPGLALQSYLEKARRFGHLVAACDPFGDPAPACEALDKARPVACQTPLRFHFGGQDRTLPQADALAQIETCYTGSIGIDADHLPEGSLRERFFARAEALLGTPPTREEIRAACRPVALADAFENFMRVKFPGKKRFGSEGSEGSLVVLETLLALALKAGTEEVVMGGMHRGRLAHLAVALGKSPATLAAELTGRDLTEGARITGDVPYHLGHRSEFSEGGRRMGVTLLPHPSHLMVVAPVTLGLARALADDGVRVLPVMLHTDAAFAAQGVTAELMQLAGLPGYGAGGTVHLVVNNRIGFTTLPEEGRSARYCTDIAKMTGVPVLHVNGDDPVAVARAAELAFAWRQDSGQDALIDLICYRRYGHNELDEPRFTQPGIWSKIDAHPPLAEGMLRRYAAAAPHLAAELAPEVAAFTGRLREGFAEAPDFAPNYAPVQGSNWALLDAVDESDLLLPVETGVAAAELRRIAAEICALDGPERLNPKVTKFWEQRLESIIEGRGITFATAEALAFATLAAEGHSIRMSGQDVVRGTFTQRHLAVHATDGGEIFWPLRRAARPDRRLEVVNSPLSEYGVLSFEYGHSLHSPDALTLWEAQFGDFLNGAQSIVDQYIVSAEAKWALRSGLVISLPHGLEGQGPDHSSARIERILQLCAGGNILVANPSTPAGLFHLLRRQLHAAWRKPLFLISPKSLLRAKAAVSDLADLAEGSRFRTVVADPPPAKAERIILCSGKIAYALQEARAEAGLNDRVAVIRLEQLYPLDISALRAALAQTKEAELVWLQEEAENQGPWPWLQAQLGRAGIELSKRRPCYARPAMPVTAGGSVERHEREQTTLLREVLTL